MPSFVLPNPGPANQPYQFCETPAQGANPALLFIKNSTHSWVYNGTSITEVTNANYPANTVYGCAYLDGTTYVMDTKGAIFGSALMDPTTWTALNFISANSEGDAPVAITRHLNYIIAFKQKSIEFLYDAGNPSPGSPLSKMVNSYVETGCSVAGSLAFTDSQVIFMGNSESKGRAIYKMEGLQISLVSTPFIDRLLNADDLAHVFAFVIKSNGHVFYVLTMKTTGVTLVLDFKTMEWHRWTNYTATGNISATTTTDANGLTTVTSTAHGKSDGDPIMLLGNTLPITFVDANTFTVTSPVPVPPTTAYTTWNESYFPGVYYTRGANVDYLLTENGANLYAFDPTVYQDAGQPINTKARTSLDDWGVMVQKTFRRLELVGDLNTTMIQVRYSDDDYQTWAQYRQILSQDNRAQLRMLGAARRRAHEIRHFDNTPLRLIALECEFDIGAR